ncbi:MAG: hypothetical protein AAF436_08280 [Myxococcota bacterium]
MAHLRAALISLHILAVLILTLPSSRQMLRREVWDRSSNQAAFAALADTFSWLGFESTEDFDRWLWGVATRYVHVRDTISEPLVVYADLAGVRQGWAMFSRPRERPIQLQVDVASSLRYQPIYQTGSREHDFRSRTFRQYRFRKLTGRLARHFDPVWYDPWSRWIARQAADGYPDAKRVRVRLYRHQTLPAEAVRAGEVPKGRFSDRRLYAAGELR